MRKKVGIVGAGMVGASAALRAMELELGDVVLYDIVEGMPQGKALDMLQAAPLYGCDCRIIGTNSFKDLAGSSVVIVTAGVPRKPGMSREDLLKVNADIIRNVSKDIARYCPDSIVIMVSNPLDLMTYLCYRITGFESRRIMGMAGVLDSVRFSTFIAEKLGVSVRDVNSMVLGSHGDTMVPLISCTTVNGIPVKQLISPEDLDAIVERTRNAGGEIVSLLKTGSAFYAPGACATLMAESILHDRKRVLACSVRPDGQYGIDDIFIGVPVVIGAGGVEKIIELKLDEREKEELRTSAGKIRQGIEELKRIAGL